MKFTSTLAVMALINNVSAITLRDDDDLFTDSADQQETLNSIAAAEKAHNSKFKGVSAEDQATIANQKSKMTFQGDNFVMNERRVLGTAHKNMPTAAHLQLEDGVRFYPQSPIGEILLEIKHNGTPDVAGKVLAGAQLNDDDDTSETLESLHAAEAISGNKMTTPSVS